MEQIEVRILDRDFRLAVAPGEKPRVLEAVRLVDERMRAVRDAGKVAGVDRIAVMAALQIAHQLLGAPEAQVGASRRLREMSSRLDDELAALEAAGRDDAAPTDAPAPAAPMRAGAADAAADAPAAAPTDLFSPAARPS